MVVLYVDPSSNLSKLAHNKTGTTYLYLNWVIIESFVTRHILVISLKMSPPLTPHPLTKFNVTRSKQEHKCLGVDRRAPLLAPLLASPLSSLFTHQPPGDKS